MKYKMYLLLAICQLSTLYAICQFSLPHQRTIGGNSDDYINSTVKTADGGLILAGNSNSEISGEKTEISKGSHDYWIVKLNKAGKIEWDKTFGGNEIENCSKIIQTRDKGYLLGGYSYSDISGDKTENSKGDADYWIVKVNSEGVKLWDKTIGGYDSDRLEDMIELPNGDIILAGSSYSGISGNKSEESRGKVDFWIVKINESGNIIWDKTIGGPKNDFAEDVVITLNNEILVGGNSDSYIGGEKSHKNKGEYDIWVVKLNAFGGFISDITIGGSKGDFLENILLLPNGEYLLCGDSWSNISGDKSENSKGYVDYWIVKLNSRNKVIFDKTIGGSRSDYLSDAIETENHNLVLGGHSYSSIGGDKSEDSKGYYDYWIVKVNTEGEILWDKTVGGSSYDYLRSIEQLQGDSYALCGHSFSGIGYDKTQKSRGGYDFWVVALKEENSPAVSGLHEGNNVSFRVYPNPANNVLNIQSDIKQVFTLTDKAGRIYKKQEIFQSGTIDVSKIPSGIYFLSDGKNVQQVIIAH